MTGRADRRIAAEHAARARLRTSTMKAPSKIAVFRALMLGDLLCATPALRALRHAWPEAHITLIALPWAADLASRLPSVDAFEPFPGWPGLPETPAPAARAAVDFVERQRRARYDLALQWHGSGGVTNALVASFGAAANGGLAARDAWRPDADVARFVTWPEGVSEVERLLRAVDVLGLPRRGDALEFPLTAADREAARALRPAARYAVVHPGSQWPSRRWPVQRFAAVADALAAQGLSVVITGSAAEAPLARELAAAMTTPAHDLAGCTTLGALGALVEGGALVVCNDTGVSHVAAALRTPSVVVASGSEVVRWRPADGTRHRVLWHDVPCRPCSHALCPVTSPQPHPCAAGVAVDSVIDAARQQLARCETGTSLA